jgi:hypothetical protein
VSILCSLAGRYGYSAELAQLSRVRLKTPASGLMCSFILVVNDSQLFWFLFLNAMENKKVIFKLSNWDTVNLSNDINFQGIINFLQIFRPSWRHPTSS